MTTGRTSRQEQKLFITVKAYPNPSKSLAEAACIAGIADDGSLIRLYPVPFRSLEDEQRFKKYQWICVEVSRPRNDPRPETYRPAFESLSVISEVVPTKNGWAARKDIVLPVVSRSMCEIQEQQKKNGASLGIFKPAEIVDFDWEKEKSPNWTDDELAMLSQEDLFLTKDQKLLEKIPYTFRYRFRCEDCRSKNGHHMKIVDWELAQFFRRESRQCTTIEECLRRTRDRFWGELCGPDKDTYFFVGNMLSHPSSFLVLGVFWPPKQRQLRLV